MVQYIFTPWRDRGELLMVRRQFYPARYHQQRRDPDQDQDSPKGPLSQREAFFIQGEDEKEASSAAVARVSMWMQRGNCPHLVESTALLTAAILDDQEKSSCPSSSYAVRAAYSAAFSRFVTGLLDSHQDKQRKMSMYGVAKSVGLPATFVELRHQATHEQLPSLIRLRAAAKKALDWIWDYYWKQLAALDDDYSQYDLLVPSSSRATKADATTAKTIESRKKEATGSVGDGCREALARCLDRGGVKKDDIQVEIKRYGNGQVLRTLNSIADTTTDSRVLRRAMALTTELLMDGGVREGIEEEDDRQMNEDGDEACGEEALDEAVRLEEGSVKGGKNAVIGGRGKEETPRQPSWSLYEEHEWIPKPIGVV